MANLAPATAWGLSLPVTLVLAFGCGKRLVRRFAASELAGRGAMSGDASIGLGGCKDARRFPSAVIEDWLASRGGLGSTCCRWLPEEARRSRKERREADGGLDDDSSGTGDAVAARAKGLRSVGSFDAVDGVRADAERTGVGVFLA
jgi:hypothetical protein